MRTFLKHLYYDTTIGHLLLFPAKKFYDIYRPRLLPEKIYIKRTFKNTFGYNLNLENPKTIQEKIQWLQLNDRTPLHTLCTDKYAVREFVKEKIGEQYLIPLLYHTDNPANIIPDNMPDYPFIIKTNHGCGGHVIVKDKSKVEWIKVRKNLKKLLKYNYYYKSREWQYKDIEPCIIVEKLLLDQNSNIPIDYKIFCFNGRVVYIAVLMDRNVDLKLNYYNPTWNLMDCFGTHLKPGDGIERPVSFNKMKSVAETLANGFRFVRVDLYNIDGDIYFGEMTFSPSAGFELINPPEWNRKFGDELKL